MNNTILDYPVQVLQGRTEFCLIDRKVKGIKQFRCGPGKLTAASLRRSARGPEVLDNAGTETARWTAGVREMVGRVGGTGGAEWKGLVRLGGGRRRREEMQVRSPVYCTSWDRLIGHTDQWVPHVSMFLLLFLSPLSCSALPPHQSITTPQQFPGLAGRGQKLRLRATRQGVRTRTVEEAAAAELRLRHRRRWLRQAR